MGAEATGLRGPPDENRAVDLDGLPAGEDQPRHRAGGDARGGLLAGDPRVLPGEVVGLDAGGAGHPVVVPGVRASTGAHAAESGTSVGSLVGASG